MYLPTSSSTKHEEQEQVGIDDDANLDDDDDVGQNSVNRAPGNRCCYWHILFFGKGGLQYAISSLYTYTTVSHPGHCQKLVCTAESDSFFSRVGWLAFTVRLEEVGRAPIYLDIRDRATISCLATNKPGIWRGGPFRANNDIARNSIQLCLSLDRQILVRGSRFKGARQSVRRVVRPSSFVR